MPVRSGPTLALWSLSPTQTLPAACPAPCLKGTEWRTIINFDLIEGSVAAEPSWSQHAPLSALCQAEPPEPAAERGLVPLLWCLLSQAGQALNEGGRQHRFGEIRDDKTSSPIICVPPKGPGCSHRFFCRRCSSLCREGKEDGTWGGGGRAVERERQIHSGPIQD